MLNLEELAGDSDLRQGRPKAAKLTPYNPGPEARHDQGQSNGRCSDKQQELSIGLVPADRGIVTRGAFRFVRHPIYTGLFIALLAFVLRAYSPLNVTLAVILMGLFMLKSVVEERFLRGNSEYAEYQQRVHHRWFPGVI